MGHLDVVELMVKPTTLVVGFVFGETHAYKAANGCGRGTGSHFKRIPMLFNLSFEDMNAHERATK